MSHAKRTELVEQMAQIPAEAVVRFQPQVALLNGKIAAGYCLTTVNGDSVENVEYDEVMATLDAAYAGQEANYTHRSHHTVCPSVLQRDH